MIFRYIWQKKKKRFNPNLCINRVITWLCFLSVGLFWNASERKPQRRVSMYVPKSRGRAYPRNLEALCNNSSGGPEASAWIFALGCMCWRNAKANKTCRISNVQAHCHSQYGLIQVEFMWCLLFCRAQESESNKTWIMSRKQCLATSQISQSSSLYFHGQDS